MKAITIVAFLALVAIVCADRDAFARFKKKHGRKYRDHDHEERRYANFKRHHDKIEKHNAKNYSFTMGHNEFSDLSGDEFRERFLHEINYATPRALPATAAPLPSSFPTGPASINYLNYVLPIRNQNPCGSCWAFASSALVETYLKRKSPTYNTFLSTQYLLNCAPNGGCSVGGNVNTALEYMRLNGLVSDASYPYTAVQGTCNRFVPKMTQKINGHYYLYVGSNEQQLANIIASVGPVAIAMYATDSFQYYRSGIYYDTTCPNNCMSTNHAMLVVGYGYDATYNLKYWLVKNSWGTTWGDNGYIRMIRGVGGIFYNNCNIACHIDYVY